MGKVVAGLAVTVLGALGVGFMLFVGSILGTVFGAFGGWFVGLLFDETLALVANVFGVPGTPPWQLGAMLGFVGGFLRTSVSAK